MECSSALNLSQKSVVAEVSYDVGTGTSIGLTIHDH